MSTAHRFRSSRLGSGRALELAAGTIDVFERGDGPVIVFAHGWFANANLWRHVVDRLHSSFRCIVLDLPFGAHRRPMPAEADLTPTGCGALISAALEALEVEGVLLVGNDSGGAYSQIATAADPRRIARLALNACETPYDAFPPAPFDGLPAAARDLAVLAVLLEGLRDPDVRASELAYGRLITRPIDDEVWDSYALPCLEDPDVLRDTAKVMASAHTAPVAAAGQVLIDSFTHPVLLAWPEHDLVFDPANAERYAKELPDGRLVLLPDTRSFTPEDNPSVLADAIATFARS